MNEPLDVLYLYGPTGRTRTGELRHSLRSLKNLPHARVWIAGWAPPWVNRHRVNLIPVPPVEGFEGDGTLKHRQTTANLLAASKALALLGVPAFVLMNDDFFITRPIEGVPVQHMGPLATSRRMRLQGPFGDAHRRTLPILRELGHQDPLSYEVHAPMIVNPQIMAPLLEEYGRHGPLLKRSLYGNVAHCGGVEVSDPKVFQSEAPVGVHVPFVSTSDAAWHGRAGLKLRARFKDPSPYEWSPVG